MLKRFLSRCTVGAFAGCGLLVVTGCGAIANAPPTAAVCYSSNGKVDPRIVYETDCKQTGGTWEGRRK
jgi:hypothetical protein